MKPPPIGWRASRKAVVYSAFWEHVALIRARLRAEGVPHATMLRHERASIKASELERFRHDPTCGVLVMDTSGVVGLDLSFASLVIAMEPVPDGSVLAQLEARAHRMGQARPIHWSPYDRVRVVNADP
jgi:SNF2 family DNA or RNA helicase